MLHAVVAVFNDATGRAELVDFGAVLTNSTLLAAVPHTITASWLVSGTFIAGIATWWMVRKVRAGDKETARALWRPAAIFCMVTILLGGVGTAISGDIQAKLMYEQQPMKMSSAEALCEGETGAAFSILTIGDLSNSCENVEHVLRIPGRHRSWLMGNLTPTCPAWMNCRPNMRTNTAPAWTTARIWPLPTGLSGS